MIIVGLGKNNHDDSVCAYLDGEVKYAKYEREVNIKSAPAPNWWFYEKVKSWGVKLKEVSLFVETDRGNFYENVDRLPLKVVAVTTPVTLIPVLKVEKPVMSSPFARTCIPCCAVIIPIESIFSTS